MDQVTVARMRVTAPPGQVGFSRQRCEDALRLASSADSRLLLIRRLALAPMPCRASPALWQARVSEKLRDQRSRAVHGGQPGAEGSESVWFRSTEEARGLLMLLLARGLRPRAWFWRLAVPDWRELPPGRWFASLLREAEARPAELAALARNLMLLIDNGLSSAAMEWIADQGALPATDITRDLPDAALTGQAHANRIAGRLSPELRERVRVVLEADATPWTSRATLARLALIAAAPELASAPAEAARLATRWLDSLQAADRERTSADLIPPSGQPHPMRSSMHAGMRQILAPAIQSFPLPAQSEARTPIAGLFLLVRPLWHLGLGDWLTARPDWLADGFGRCLLAAIGRRMRAESVDPIFESLGTEPPLPEWQDALRLWRIGLDRWLTRSAGIRLADVVNRPGWIAACEDRLDIRFGVDQADLRLRRQALDLDPGWVDWLGLVVRYHYRDTP